MNVKTKTMIYWATTGLFALAMTGSGIMTFSQQPQMVEGYAHLGFPVYLMTLLGIWKLLGVTALLSPGLPRLKEWAYAGFTFNLTGATFAHLMAGDGTKEIVTPLVILGIALTSWATRSGARQLPEQTVVAIPASGAQALKNNARAAA